MAIAPAICLVEGSDMKQPSPRGFLGSAAVVGILGLAATAAAQTAVTHSGRGIGAIVGAQAFADTGELPPEGGLLSADLDSLLTGVATATNLLARTSGGNQVANTTASLEDGLIDAASGAIVVSSVQADAVAACEESAEAHGSSTIVGLFADGQAIVVTGEPNQVVSLGDGTLILNQQTIDPVEGGLVITVNALRFVPAEGIEVVLGNARAGIAGCTAPPADCHDFVTGSGSIGLGGAGHGSFGFNAGFKPSSSTPSISLNYIDHVSNKHVKAQTIDLYELLGPNVRHFSGTGTRDGIPVEYSITVADNGEPGTTDTFEMALSDGYVAGGTIESGNVQLHKPCP
jgi:hypothetical protein